MERERLGHYRIETRLGEGGMGLVYRAVDEVLGRTVAIKALQSALLNDAAARARFQREARAIAALNHPAIAAIFEAGEADGSPFLVMEYVEGRTLREEVAGRPLPARDLLAYAKQLASALQHAHQRGVLHRDIKSANIIVAGHQQVKLLDFGLAQLARPRNDSATVPQITAEGTWVGTLHYAAPEVLTGSPASARSDIYSLGVVLYEMACGQTPFAAVPAAGIAAAILQGKCERVSKRNPTIPASIEAVIMRAISPRPEDRYRDAGELLKALEACCSGASVEPATAPSFASDLLAVLEFQNVSGDTSMDWLATGIAETLMSDLKKVRELRVATPERVRRALHTTGCQVDPVALGEQLGARWLVSGSYQRSGPRMRITTRIVDTETGSLITTAKLDGSYDEIFDLQDRVAQEVANALRVRMDESTIQRIVAPDTRKLEAYEAYAQARRCFDRLEKSSLEEARQLFDRALQLDPEYAMAHSGLGATYCMRYIHRTDPDDLVRALGHLERARELDHELAEPYPWLCYAYMRRGKIEEALTAGERGTVLQPDLVTAHYFLGAAYIVASQIDPKHYQAAVDQFVSAIRTEPQWAPSWLLVGELAVLNGEYGIAEECAREVQQRMRTGQVISRFPGAESLLANVAFRRGEWTAAVDVGRGAVEALAHIDHMYRETLMAVTCCLIGDAHLRMGQPDAALGEYRRAWHMLHEFPRMLGHERVQVRTLCGLASAYAANGRLEQGRQSLAQVEVLLETVAASPGNWVFDSALAQLMNHAAVAYVHCGHRARALELLERSFVAGWRDAHWLTIDPELDPLRDEQRFRTVMEKIEACSPVIFGLPRDAMALQSNANSAG